MIKINKENRLLFLALVLMAIFGCGLLWSGLMLYQEEVAFGEKCIETTGYVVGREWSLYEGEDVYYGIYEYNVDGTTYTIVKEDWSRYEPEVGDTDSIWYDPENPSNAYFEQYQSKGAVSILFGNIFIMAVLAFFFGSFMELPDHVSIIIIGTMFTLLGLIFPLFVQLGVMEIILYIFGIVGIYMVAREIFSIVHGKDSEEVQQMDKELGSFLDFLSIDVEGGIAGRHAAIGGIIFIAIFGFVGLLFGWVGIGIIRGGEFFMGLVVTCMFGICPIGMAAKEIRAIIESYKRQKNNDKNA